MIHWFGITNQKGMQYNVDIRARQKGAGIEKEGERK
jgi:hypothetical protein